MIQLLNFYPFLVNQDMWSLQGEVKTVDFPRLICRSFLEVGDRGEPTFSGLFSKLLVVVKIGHKIVRR